MPPRKKAASRAKKAVPQPDPEPEPPETVSKDVTPVDSEDEGAQSDQQYEEDEQNCPGSPLVDSEDKFNEKICDFFEDHTHFYDMTHTDYKNKQRRNFELSQFAAVLGHGWTADKVWRRFLSLRTDYGKLRGMVQKGKSGSGAVKWTPKQRWKLQRMQFLNPFMKGAGSATQDEMGKVSISQNVNCILCSVIPYLREEKFIF